MVLRSGKSELCAIDLKKELVLFLCFLFALFFV